MGILDNAKDLAGLKDKAEALLDEHGDKLPEGVKDKVDGVKDKGPLWLLGTPSRLVTLSSTQVWPLQQVVYAGGALVVCTTPSAAAEKTCRPIAAGKSPLKK